MFEGEVVYAVEEVFNSEGTLRLRIAKPVTGYISKLVGLVEKAPLSEFANEKLTIRDNKDISAKLYTEKELLEKVEDNMDIFTGTDAYNKDERYFGIPYI